LLHLGERLVAHDHGPRILRGKGRLVAEKLVNGISFTCHFTVGRRHPALHPQAVDVAVTESDHEPDCGRTRIAT
jgi:hypothetical protein